MTLKIAENKDLNMLVCQTVILWAFLLRMSDLIRIPALLWLVSTMQKFKILCLSHEKNFEVLNPLKVVTIIFTTCPDNTNTCHLCVFTGLVWISESRVIISVSSFQ